MGTGQGPAAGPAAMGHNTLSMSRLGARASLGVEAFIKGGQEPFSGCWHYAAERGAQPCLTRRSGPSKACSPAQQEATTSRSVAGGSLQPTSLCGAVPSTWRPAGRSRAMAMCPLPQHLRAMATAMPPPRHGCCSHGWATRRGWGDTARGRNRALGAAAGTLHVAGSQMSRAASTHCHKLVPTSFPQLLGNS